MTLYEKIMALYPSLTDRDFIGINSTIELQNDLNEKGDYIAKWEHPTLAQPTKEQLEAIE
jgi:hypothetical protein